MALLLPDNETLVQMQPVYRCGFWPSPLLARWGNATDGGPQQFPNTTSIFGDGTLGAHGGSGLSSIGGSIQLGGLADAGNAISDGGGGSGRRVREECGRLLGRLVPHLLCTCASQAEDYYGSQRWRWHENG